MTTLITVNACHSFKEQINYTYSQPCYWVGPLI